VVPGRNGRRPRHKYQGCNATVLLPGEVGRGRQRVCLLRGRTTAGGRHHQDNSPVSTSSLRRLLLRPGGSCPGRHGHHHGGDDRQGVRQAGRRTPLWTHGGCCRSVQTRRMATHSTPTRQRCNGGQPTVQPRQTPKGFAERSATCTGLRTACTADDRTRTDARPHDFSTISNYRRRI
jgi:hypothetical protein